MSGKSKPDWNAVSSSPQLKLEDGDRVGVIGCGPSGSFFSYFFLEMAQRVNLDINLDIYEPRDFFQPSPKGCNMCGGIVSETLVQMLAAEGINLPPQIVQRGIESYTLHTDRGTVSIETPLHEKRIAAVHRGGGPKGTVDSKWGSFDGYLQILAIEKGANLFQSKVERVLFDNGRPKIIIKDEDPVTYDLLVVAVGVNSRILNIFTDINTGYRLPRTTKTIIREYYLGEEMISQYFGNSMHIFLLDLPNVEFAAFIPKGDYVTFCMLGKDITPAVLATFMETPEVRQALPETIYTDQVSCHCNPKINIQRAIQPFADRMVFIGDCGVTRLYKDGIGGATGQQRSQPPQLYFREFLPQILKSIFGPYASACTMIISSAR